LVHGVLPEAGGAADRLPRPCQPGQAWDPLLRRDRAGPGGCPV